MIELSNLNEISDDKESVLNNIVNVKKINCEILKSGFNPVKNYYYYCNCENNIKEPICQECMETCHKDHKFTKKEIIEAICSCGIKSHIIKKDSEFSNRNYHRKCFFSELSEVTKLNVYYTLNHKQSQLIYCMFCYNFCQIEKTAKNFDQNFLKKKLQRKNNKIPSCNCSHTNHDNIEKLFNILNKISAKSFTSFRFENITYTHFINAIVNSSQTFDNLYIFFQDGIQSISSSILDEKYQFEDVMDTTNSFFLSLENLSKLFSSKKNFNYLTQRLQSDLGDYVTFQKIIERKFDMKQRSVWKIKIHYLSLYIAFKLKTDMNAYPKIKIHDIKLLNPLQRIIISRDIQKFSNENLNIIELALNMISRLNREKEKLPETFCLISKFYSICKLFAKHSLFSQDQLNRFFLTNDEIILKLAEARQQCLEDRLEKMEMINYQLKILSKILKSLTYIIYHYNDQYIVSYLLDGNKLDDVKFYTTSELTKKLSRNAINIMSSLRIYKQVETSFEKDKQIEELLFYASDIVSISLTINEDYYSSMKRLMPSKNCNSGVYISLIRNCLSDKEILLLEFLKENAKTVEKSYHNYFNFKISALQLRDVVKQSINEFFYLVNLKDYDYTGYIESKKCFNRQVHDSKPHHNILLRNNNSVNKNIQLVSDVNYSSYNSYVNLNLAKNSDEKPVIDMSNAPGNSDYIDKKEEFFRFQILLNKNFYIYSIIKIIKIFAEQFSEKADNSSRNTTYQIEDSLFSSVIKILTFFVQDNPDNSMIFLSSEFVEMINTLRGEQQIQILDLFRISVKNIQEEKIEMAGQCHALIKSIGDIVREDTNNSYSFKLVDKIILIVKSLLKVPFVKKDRLIEKLREIVKHLHKNFTVLTEYKNYLKEGVAIKLLEETESEFELGREMNSSIGENLSINLNSEKSFPQINQKKNYSQASSQIDYNEEHIIKIFTKFLKIVNNIFTGDSIIEENNFLVQIIFLQEFPMILKKKDLKIKFRTEILKFIRIINTDTSIHNGKLYFYRSLIIDPAHDTKSPSYFHDEYIERNGIFKLYQDLMLINRNFDMESKNFEFAILKFELKNYEIIFRLNLGEQIKNIVNYLERGILFSIKIYMDVTFSCVNSSKGEDVLHMYEILYYFLKMKEFVLTNFDFSKLLSEKSSEEKNPFIEEFINNNQNILLLNTKYILENKKNLLIELRKDIEEISSPNFEIFNSVLIFNLFKKHFESMTIRETKRKSILKLFSKRTEFFSKKKIQKLEESLLTQKHLNTHYDYRKQIFQLLIKYANDKNNFECNKFLEILEEVNNYYYMKYRQQHIRNLLFLFNETKFSQELKREAIWNIFRLLQNDTIATQKCFSELHEKKSDLLNFSDFVENFFKNFLCVLFKELNPGSFFASNNYDYYTAISIIKIFKYLCEEHNQIFQRIFFQEIVIDYISLSAYPKMRFGEFSENFQNRPREDQYKIEDSIEIHAKQISFIENFDRNSKNTTLFDFMLCVMGKVFIISGWNEVDCLASNSDSFYYDIFSSIIELLIEMVQGTEGDNLKSVIKAEDLDSFYSSGESIHFAEFLLSIKPILFRRGKASEIIYKIKTDLIEFLMAFLEEKNTPVKLVTFMSRIIHPHAMIEAIVEVMKKLYEKENNFSENLRSVLFDHKVCDYFSEVFFDYPEFSENPEFVLANRMYHYLKQLGTNKKFLHKDANYILNLVDVIPASRAKLKLQFFQRENSTLENSSINFEEKKMYENYFCVKFFEKIIRTVFVQLESNTSGNDSENKPVPNIFTLNPLIRYLSNHTRIDFYEKVDRSSRHIKLYSLMTQCDQFFYEVKYYSERATKNKFLKFLNKINYFWLEASAFFLTLVINIIMIAVLGPHDNIHGNERYTPIIEVLAYLNIALNFMFICIWFYSKFYLYYMIERKQIIVKNNSDKNSLLSFVKILFNSVLKKPEINGFLWNLVVCSIGVSKRSYNFAYSLQLLAIINLSETLKNIIRSIVSKFRQLTATLSFVFLLCYIFASAAFYYFSEDFIINIFDPEHPEIPKYAQNQCSNLVLCFLTHVDYGLRTDGGIGEYMNKRRSFVIEPGYYIARFLYEDLFFILVIVILLSLVFGIVIDAFAELRDKYLKNEKDKKDTCFICGASREQLEKKCENFNLHVMKVHNMWTYADYIIGLKFVDVQETNAINSYVIEQVEMKQTAWLPVEEEVPSEEKESM